ncbi:unnamed protein product [Bursaphelenchus okinawaensis]|uniref:Uncharacterized protein n=1 Tax=Bursaphelenchus okinawaensis TaxID=465554 RepID=A0A811LDT5_9BILA|nr:unnamed protein product [Bursaphelenchus okinawaensis]CAG9120569.1 unnamed protein product [Bursaphelenchus okinawaensis]
MVSNSKLSSTSRRKTSKFLRYALRRKPCTGMVVVGAVVIPLLILLCIFFFFWIRSSYIHNEIFRRDKALLRLRGDEISFQHCAYQDPGEYNTSFCELYCGEAAQSWRLHHLKTDQYIPPTCLDKHEQVRCTDVESVYCIKPSQGHIDCPGSKLDGSSDSNVGEGEKYIVIPDADELKNMTGKVVLANQLVGKCPTCTVRSDYFKFTETGTCYRKMSTLTLGWPGNLQYCTNLEKAGKDQHCTQLISGNLG